MNKSMSKSVNKKIASWVGWIASCMSATMYFSYIDQIVRNIAGTKGSLILPIVTTIACSIWIAYGFLKPKIDWPIIACNAFGIIFGVVTAITALPFYH